MSIHKYGLPYLVLSFSNHVFSFLPLPNEQKYEHFLTELPGSMNVILCYTICNLSHFALARSQFGFLLQPKALPHYCNLLLFSLSLGLSHCIHAYHLSFSSSFVTSLKALLNSLDILTNWAECFQSLVQPTKWHL